MFRTKNLNSSSLLLFFIFFFSSFSSMIMTKAMKAPNPSSSSKLRQFVFAYGSLMNPESRAITNPNLANQDGLAVVVNDVERVWSARTSSGYTAMGVRFHPGVECTGVLLEVSPQELADLDVREANYDRREITLENVDQVPFLPDRHYETEQAEVLFDAKDAIEEEKENDTTDDNGSNTDDGSDDQPESSSSASPPKEQVKVWVYVQKERIPSDQSHPIPQSYVDIILRGCLTISKDFARSVIETTKGWNHEEEPNFVDDRETPIYIRADPEAPDAHVIDQLLEEHKPQAFEERIEYDPEDHLEALYEAHAEDLAHPRAVEKAELRVEALQNDEEEVDDETIPGRGEGIAVKS